MKKLFGTSSQSTFLISEGHGPETEVVLNCGLERMTLKLPVGSVLKTFEHPIVTLHIVEEGHLFDYRTEQATAEEEWEKAREEWEREGG